ncbi:predicted protein [Nematostella vectensis]|uniref:EF-hand domain-containing protein n=1 Tax=Nematostella vectensis TaxID=45351 RepID=A7T5T7_NEMVE|nr:predicted protein [Nematostella vectensis]|eukprot:XP_001620775.1 hypothetical protein NEMVEDRAFT_v1g222716 [Nematostella vectensis]
MSNKTIEDKLREMENLLREKEGEIGTAKEALAKSRERLQKKDEEMSYLNRALEESLKEKKKDLDDIKGYWEDEVKQKVSEISSLMVSSEDALQSKDAQMFILKSSFEKKIAEQEEEISALKRSLKEMVARPKRGESEEASLLSEIATMKSELASCREIVREAQSTENELLSKMNTYRSMLADKEREIESLRSAVVLEDEQRVSASFLELNACLERVKEENHQARMLNASLQKALTEKDVTIEELRLSLWEAQNFCEKERLRLKQANEEAIRYKDREIEALKSELSEEKKQLELEIEHVRRTSIDTLSMKEAELQRVRKTAANFQEAVKVDDTTIDKLRALLEEKEYELFESREKYQHQLREQEANFEEDKLNLQSQLEGLTADMDKLNESLADLLGLKNKKLKAKTQHEIQIKGLEAIFIHCDLVNASGSLKQGAPSQILACIELDKGKINFSPHSPVQLSATSVDYVQLDIERWLKRKFREGFSDMKHAFMELDLDRTGRVRKDDFRKVLAEFDLKLSTDKQVEDFLARCGVTLTSDDLVPYKEFLRRFQDRSQDGMPHKILANQLHRYHHSDQGSQFSTTSAVEARLMDLFQRDFLALLGTFHNIDRKDCGLLTQQQFRAAIEGRFELGMSDEEYEDFLTRVPINNDGMIFPSATIPMVSPRVI